MGKKKDKKKAEAVQEGKQDGDDNEPVDATGDEDTGAKEVKPTDDASNYKAAAVVFFTRRADGTVDQVLVATEDRKVDAKWIGLSDQKGKVEKKMVVFPMGRREKKDKGDSVETAKREYVEETTDFGGLARYLDFADFSKEEEKDIPEAQKDPKGPCWTGLKNFAVYFSPAGLVVLFCEVLPKEVEAAVVAPPKLAQETQTPPQGAEPPQQDQSDGTSEPAQKKAKTIIEKPVGNPSYHVGKTDHVRPTWMSVDDLKSAVQSTGRAPTLKIHDDDCYWFPLSVSVLRMAESRTWLGLASADAPTTEGK